MGVEVGQHFHRNAPIFSNLELVVQLWQLLREKDIDHATPHQDHPATIIMSDRLVLGLRKGNRVHDFQRHRHGTGKA
jgi:hypothetical protein